MISRSITVDYMSLPCKYAFNITLPPEVDTRINHRYGGFSLSYPRLAFIGGKADPWREATPFADDAPGPGRKNTLNRPFVEIEGGVHHCKIAFLSRFFVSFFVIDYYVGDENGLFPTRRHRHCRRSQWRMRRRMSMNL